MMTRAKTETCVFCAIVAGEVPAAVVYEDEHFMAFLDINPPTPGCVQVIPRRHFRWVWDLPSSDRASKNEASLGDYFEVAQRIALAQREAFGTDWIISKVVGEEVPHAHIWVFPGDAKGDPSDLATNARLIRETLDL